MEELVIIIIGMWLAGFSIGIGIGIPLGRHFKTNEDSAKKAKEIDNLVNSL